MNYKYLLQLTTVVYVFSFVGLVSAEDVPDITVTCSGNNGSSVCTAEPPATPLFSVVNLKPTDLITKTVEVVNQYNGPRNILLKTVPISDDESLSEKIIVTISKNEGDSIWTGTLKDMFDGNVIALGTIQSGDSQIYIFDVELDQMGNEYQDSESRFELTVLFEAGHAPAQAGWNHRNQNHATEVPFEFNFRNVVDVVVTFIQDILNPNRNRR